MFRKNRQNTVYFTILDKDTGEPITTGNVTARVIKDGSLYSTNTLTAGSNFISSTSVWKYDFATAALNGDSIALGLTHANGVPQVININTFEYDMKEIYDGITALQAGVTIGHVGPDAVTGISDFYTSTTGLSTFDATTDFVTFAIPEVDIVSVNGAGVTIGDFRATGITATIDGIVQANVVIEDFHASTSGLSTFDAATDFVNVASLGITAGGLASSAVTKIVNGVFNQIVDGSISFDTVMEMLLAWMAGKVTVTDNGSNRDIEFFRRDGTTNSFTISVDETDSQEGQRSSTGSIT
jgi:hypothetical protein